MISAAMIAVALAVQAPGAALPRATEQPALAAPVEMTAAQLFAYADAARDRGDFALAEKAYRALMQDPDPELRTEARFRLTPAQPLQPIFQTVSNAIEMGYTFYIKSGNIDFRGDMVGIKD